MRFNFHGNTTEEVLEFSRAELSVYLCRMLPDTGAEQCMEVFLSAESTVHGDADDRYELHARPDRVEITASNPRSVLLGVYRLLFELGCRFLMPGRTHEYIPRIAPEHIHVDLAESAALRHRGVCIEGADSLENILDHIDWLPKIGCNTFFLQHLEPEAFLENWYTHKYNPKLEPTRLSSKEKKEMYQQINRAIARRGLLQHRGGHGWTSQAIGFRHVCTRCSHGPAEAQRGLLAQIAGRRDYWNGVPSNTNLCYSEPAARHAFVDAAVLYARQHPEVDYLHVWLADEYNNICECERCRSTTPSDQYISLLNELDAQLNAQGLATHIVLLLYQELLWPPIKEKLRNPARFILMFAPISRTFSRSYAERGAPPPIPPYRRNQIELPHSLEENLAFLSAWQHKCSIDSFVYDYPLGRAHYGDLGYHQIARIIWRDILELRNLKLNGYVSCQELRAALPNAFPEYVMGRMLWDTTLPFEQLEQEYFSALYGAHWETVRDYLSGLSARSSCDYFNGIGPRLNSEMAELWRQGAEYVSRTYPTVRQTLRAEAPVQKQAVKLLDYHAKYCTLLMRALSALAAGNSEAAADRWKGFMEYIREQEVSFQPYLDVYRVLEVATKYTGFSLDIPR